MVNTLIKMDKMYDGNYIDDMVLLSYDTSCINSQSKQFILAFISNNINIHVKHNCIAKGDEIFADMKFPGFFLKMRVEFL